MFFFNRKQVQAEFEEQYGQFMALMKSCDEEIAVSGRLFLQYKRKLALIAALPFWTKVSQGRELTMRARLRYIKQARRHGYEEEACNNIHWPSSESYQSSFMKSYVQQVETQT